MEYVQETSKQFVIFRLEKQLYGMDIQSVQIIERMKDIMRVPKTPKCIKGVMNLRGEILPVINMREKFELPEKEYTDSTRIIIVKLEEEMVGIIVDEVKEVAELKLEQIENVQNMQGKMNMKHITGIGKLEQEQDIITLLNLKNIIDEAFEL